MAAGSSVPCRSPSGLWQSLLPENSEKTIFVFVVLLALVARATSFSLGYSIDDYRFFSDNQWLHAGVQPLMISQGRVGLVVLIHLLEWLGFSPPRDYVLGSVLMTLALAWLAWASLKLSGLGMSLTTGVIAALIITLHPYHVEYFTFRVSLLLLPIPVASVAVALSVNEPSFRRVFLAAAALSIGTAMWQLAIVLFATASLFAAACRFACIDLGSRGSLASRAQIAIRDSRLLINICAALAGLCLYAVVFWSSLRIWGIRASSRASLVTAGELPHRARQIWDLIGNLLIRSEPVFPHGPKLVLLILFLIAALVAICRSVQQREPHVPPIIIISVLIFPAALLVSSTVAVTSVHDWWPVPRALIAVAWFWAFLGVCTLSWLEHYGGRRPMQAAAIALAIVTVAMISLNNQVLADQLRLNIRDREEMNRIVGRLEMMPGFDKVSRLLVVGGSWGYASPISTLQGDMNASALFPSWSKVPLAREVSGYAFQTVDVPSDVSRLSALCQGGKKWPSAESMYISGETAVVCLLSP
jgi:hypothetical protein